jgi:LEA14-like dessication related protein
MKDERWQIDNGGRVTQRDIVGSPGGKVVKRNRPPRRWSSIFHLTSSILLLAACATMGRSTFATPIVELHDIRMKAIGFQGGSMEIILDVTNPNDYRLDATRLTYNLFVDTMRVAFGEIKQTATLEAHKKSEVVVPVSFSIQELIRATQLMSKSGGVDYHVTGEVTAATPGGSFTRPYQGNGHFDNIASLKPR